MSDGRAEGSGPVHSGRVYSSARRRSIGLRISERRLLLLLGDLLMLGLALAGALWIRGPWISEAYRKLGRTYKVLPLWWGVLWVRHRSTST